MREITNMIPVNKYVCDICGVEYHNKRGAEECEATHLIMEYIKTLQVGHIYYLPWLKKPNFSYNQNIILVRTIIIKDDGRDFTIKEAGSDVEINIEAFKVRDSFIGTYLSLDVVKTRLDQIKELSPIEAIENGMKINTDVLIASEPLARTYESWLLTKSPLYLINRFYAGGELTELTTKTIVKSLLNDYRNKKDMGNNICNICLKAYANKDDARKCEAVHQFINRAKAMKCGTLYSFEFFNKEKVPSLDIVTGVNISEDEKKVTVSTSRGQIEIIFENYKSFLPSELKELLESIKPVKFTKAFKEGWIPDETEMDKYPQIRELYINYIAKK